MPVGFKLYNLPVFSCLLVSALNAAPAAPQRPIIIDKANIHIELMPRTPDQMASFYEARGFPVQMINALKQACFFTVRIHNRREDIAWLELANWSFSHAGKSLQRLHREIWQSRWQDMNMPLASRSTFRWTLLPETLDYLPDEAEGGNIILPRVNGNIELHAVFNTGENKHGPKIKIDFPEFGCASNQ